MEHARANVKVLMANIEKAGQNHVRNALSEPGRDPFKAIADVQDSLSIGFIRIDPALQFLDALGLTRLAVNSSLLESLKDTLLQTVQHMTEDSLVSLLKATYIFMAVADLKAIPVAVLKRLRRIPDRYLEFLLQKGYIAVRRPAALPAAVKVALILPVCRSFLSRCGDRPGRSSTSTSSQLWRWSARRALRRLATRHWLRGSTVLPVSLPCAERALSGVCAAWRRWWATRRRSSAASRSCARRATTGSRRTRPA